MDLPSFLRLLASEGQDALQEAMALQPREEDFLSLFTALSRRFPPDLARAALETAILRGEAAGKFPFSGQMYFTRQALEQSTAFPVSSYRAERFRSFRRLVDAGCSIGGDTLALAPVAPTAGIDIDPLRLAMARANLDSLGLGERAEFLRLDLNLSLPLAGMPGAALFFDPARRTGHRRAFSVREYTPPLGVVQGWLPHFPALSVKISPGVDLAEIEAYDAEVEFISLGGELKEAVLWFGPLKSTRRRATVLPGPHSMQSASESSPAGSTSQPRRFLFEPDPSILRAGLVTDLGEVLGATQLDPEIAYLTADDHRSSPFTRWWRVEDWFPFSLKRLRTYLRVRSVGQVVVKKRGSPLQPEALIHDLRLKGEAERVVFLTQLRGQPVVIVCFKEEPLF
ncbi:MAG: SAM-dependent methyltransferase [Chloroflexota bacterium]|nr:MAG: SAM-dependent methyltransferase [Chloroflexota bacterium]